MLATTPSRIESAPRPAPTVLSSKISKGAGSAPGFQQHRQIIGAFGAEISGNNAAAAQDGGLDGRGGNNFIIENDCQSFANIVFGGFAKLFAAGRIEFKTDDRLTFLKLNPGVFEVLTADNRLAEDDIGFTFGSGHQTGISGKLAATGVHGGRAAVDQMETHFSGFAQQRFYFFGILKAGQLNDNAGRPPDVGLRVLWSPGRQYGGGRFQSTGQQPAF